jgi:hypothetical protein
MRGWVSIAVTAALLAGCANVKVHKVDVQDRIDGKDQHVKGFRYYLTRPYLVVARRVPVSVAYIPVAPGLYPASDVPKPGQPLPPHLELVLVAVVPDAKGAYAVYDRAGHPRPDISPGRVYVLPQAGTGGGPIIPNLDAILPHLSDAIAAEVATRAVAAGTDLKLTDDEKKTLTDRLRTAFATAANQAGSDLKKYITQKAVEDTIKEGINVAVTEGNKFLKDKGSAKQLALSAADLADAYQMVLAAVTAKPGAKPPAVALPFGAAATLDTKPQANAPKAPAAAPGSPPPADGTPGGDFQVIFLPDFEEQYAINNVNVLAKTKYKYTFRNGTELESMAGSYNATDVPVKIVETVGRLVQAVGEVAKTRLTDLPVGARAMIDMTAKPTAAFYLRVEQGIEPGVYRVQKSWERAAAEPLDGLAPDQVCGLFAEIGLPINETVSVITGTEHDQATGLAKVPPAP